MTYTNDPGEAPGPARQRRDRLYIIAAILAIARNGSIKTHIMYRANLSFAQLNEYLNFLLKEGLLDTDTKNKRTAYKTTRKGVNYLGHYEEISKVLGREAPTNGSEESLFSRQ